MARGYSDPTQMTLGTLWSEVHLARAAVNGMLASQIALTQLAIGSIMSQEGGRNFQKAMKELTDGDN